jgi:hypothetical protein
MNRYLMGSIVALSLAGATAAFAQPPAQNINPWRHGNLAQAQQLTRQAFDRLTAAQQANEFQLGGHAGHAKDLLRQAADEMRMAADAANRR